MIKYLGSKRLLVPVLGAVAEAVGARTAVDLFTGTTRVAQEFKHRGVFVTAADVASYAVAFAETYVATDRDAVDHDELAAVVADLDTTPGIDGYVTETFCRRSRYFQPQNGMRIDAIRDRIESEYAGHPLRPLLLTSLVEAADRVDSTTGLQMAYLKQWSARSSQPLALRVPALLLGPGAALAGDVRDTVGALPPVDLMYLDPPYNQHRYFTNYHVWETLVRWDAPDHYGIACKRIDARDEATKSAFNKRHEMGPALFDVIARARTEVLALSYNDESWLGVEELTEALRAAGYADVQALAFDSKRYVGAQIGIYNPAGERVGRSTRLRNVEYLFLAGPSALVTRAARAALGATRQGGPQLV